LQAEEVNLKEYPEEGVGRLDMRDDFDREWESQAKAMLGELKVWRLGHPKATLREIEAATDRRLDRLRSQLISDTATASDGAEWGAASEERPVCPDCLHPLQARGRQERRLQSQGSEPVRLERQYGVCPACGAGLFPPG
jgi:hypothetical protein